MWSDLTSRASSTTPLNFLDQLLDHGLHVPYYADLCALIVVKLLGLDVDPQPLDFARAGPFWRAAVVEDPVESGAEDEDDVGRLEGGRAGGGDAERMRVGQVTFAHRGWEERDRQDGQELSKSCL